MPSTKAAAIVAKLDSKEAKDILEYKISDGQATVVDADGGTDVGSVDIAAWTTSTTVGSDTLGKKVFDSWYITVTDNAVSKISAK